MFKTLTLIGLSLLVFIQPARAGDIVRACEQPIRLEKKVKEKRVKIISDIKSDKPAGREKDPGLLVLFRIEIKI